MDLIYALGAEYIRIATAFDSGKIPLAEAQGQFAKAEADFRTIEAQRLQSARAQMADQQAQAAQAAIAQQQAEEMDRRARTAAFFGALKDAARSFSGQ